jgi:hypothetical protein
MAISVLTVGAVYDRAFFPFECDNRAVIDRAYSEDGERCSMT